MSDYPIIGMVASRRVWQGQIGLAHVGILDTYTDAVMAAGGLPYLIPQNLDEERLDAVLDLVDGVLLPGGGDISPEQYGEVASHERIYGVDGVRDETEMALVRKAVERDLPILGICRGLQVINVGFGG